MALTDAKIRNAKPIEKPVKLADAGGLYLEVRTSGAKLWRYRYRIAGKENVFAIGEYFNDKRVGHVSLDEARGERDKARALVKQGIHPAHHRHTQRMAQLAEASNTFEGVAREWIAKKEPAWTAYYMRQVERFLEADAFPYIGNLPIRSVTAAHLLEIVRRVEERGAETVALLVRQWCSAIFRYAVATLRADGDPAAALKGAINRPKIAHGKPLSRDQIAAFVNALDGYAGYRTTVIALRLKLLTFVCTIELRAAEWTEIDLERAEWRIPAGAHEDARVAHRPAVPASPRTAAGTAHAHGRATLAVPQPPPAGSMHDGNDPEPRAGTHGLQRQGEHRLRRARLPRDRLHHSQ